MRYLLALLIAALPLCAQVQITTNATIQPDTVEPFRALIESDYLEEADTNGNGLVTNSEGIAWLQNIKIQRDLVEHFARQAILRAEQVNRASLPQAFQDALAAKDAAEADIQAQRELMCPGCWGEE